MTDCPIQALEMSIFPFMIFLFFSNELVLESSAESATLPSRITPLSGSCVRIPCAFKVPEDKLIKATSISGFWIKYYHAYLSPGSLVVYNGSTNITTGFNRIEITGNLSQFDCTTVFYDMMSNHSDNYYFRVEIKPNWLYSYQNAINILVSDSPQPPELKSTDLRAVMENTIVNLSCSAEAPCPEQPPTISWSYIPESAQITTQLQEKPDKTQSVFSHMTFKASYMDHRKNISCTATYPRISSNDSTVETTVIMLQVLFPPKETRITIEPSASVSVGTNVTLTCKSKANPSGNVTFWHKHGQEKQLDLGELTFTVNSSSQGWYFCKAENEHGFQKSEEIQLIVEGSVDQSLIIGCVVGVSAILLTFLLITLFLRVQRVKASTIKETDVSDQGLEKQVQTIYANGGFVPGDELEMPKDENDIIHYGEIEFSTTQTKITSVQGSGLETVYAEVRCPGKEMNQD